MTTITTEQTFAVLFVNDQWERIVHIVKGDLQEARAEGEHLIEEDWRRKAAYLEDDEHWRGYATIYELPVGTNLEVVTPDALQCADVGREVACL